MNQRRTPCRIRARRACSLARISLIVIGLLLLALGAPHPAEAQAGDPGIGTGASGGGPALVVDPPRGAAARAVATRIGERPRIDGVLDEPFWATIPPITAFVQRDPIDGGVPSERTEMRIAYDEDNLYFGITLHDSDPTGIRASILQRGGWIGLDDHIVIALDTFNDRRNGYLFEINPLGTQDDALFTDETIQDWNWDGVYWSEARITEEGWVLEVAIPFRTIRFPREEVLEMGLLVFRSIRRKNETVFWPHLPATYRSGYAQASQYGTLVGLREVTPGRNLQVKPYLLGGGNKAGVADLEGQREFGVDVKYGITSSLTLDLTYNTDFAQVEADNVQINLDRFSLFFPEKRDFFLERAGLFVLGAPGEAQLFFSRRVGLENPIIGGGRLTGQLGRFTVGLLNLQTGERGARAAANSGVARVRADLGPRASIGGLVSNLREAGDDVRALGLDTQLRFLGSSGFDAWVARLSDPRLRAAAVATDAPSGPADGQAAGSAQLRIRNATYGAAAGYTNIGRDFLPALGFVRRPDQVRWNAELNYTPRFEGGGWARSLEADLKTERIAGQDGQLQSEMHSVDGRLQSATGDQTGWSLARRVERLERPFAIRPGTVLPGGDYTFDSMTLWARTNGSRVVAGNANVTAGQFYHGHRTELRGGVRLAPSAHFTVAPGVAHNVVSLPVAAGDFTVTVLDLNVKLAASRFLFADALVQYDDVSRRTQANIRVNWIHRPGSNLFLVLDTGYNGGPLADPRDSRWERRGGVAKLTYLWSL